MKSLQFIAAFFLIFTSVLITSCETEPLDSDLLAQLENGGGTDGGDGGTGGGSGGGGTGGGGTSTGDFKVDLDGKTMVASSVQAIVNDDYISITGIKTSTGEIMQITLSSPNTKVGTYTLKNTIGGTFALAYIPKNGSEPLLAVPEEDVDFPEYKDTATLTITKLDKVSGKISGTFQFTGFKFVDLSGTEILTKKFTNGSFSDVSFKNDIPVVETKNTFKVKMDGVSFVPTFINGISIQGKISIVARKGSIENVGFTFASSITPGTYELSLFGDATGVYNRSNNPDGSGIFAIDNGTLVITSHDKTKKIIVGTFNFVAESFFSPEKVNFTEGSFTIYY